MCGDKPVYPFMSFYHFEVLTSMLGRETEKPTKDLRSITQQNNSKASLDTGDSYWYY
jgi:hypothetical protein